MSVLVNVKGPRHRISRGMLDAWPEGNLRRTIVQALFSLPFLLISFTNFFTHPDLETPNLTLIIRAAGIKFSGQNLNWLDNFNPPITTLFGLIFNNTLALGIVGSFVAGWFAHSIFEMLIQKRVPIYLRVLILFAAVFNPITLYNATENFGGFLLLACISVGTIQMVRFIELGDTYNGFQASLAFAAASLSSNYGIIFVILIVATSSLLKWHRGLHTGAKRSTLTVTLLPSIGLTGSFLVIGWMLTGQVTVNRITDLFAGFNWATLSMVSSVWHTPLFLSFVAPAAGVWVIAQFSHRKGALFFSFVLVLLQLTVLFLILQGQTVGTGVTYLLLVFLSLALIPQSRTLGTNIVIAMTIGFQIIISYWIIIVRYETLGTWTQSTLTFFGIG